jgi:hypothetical protein
MKASFLCLSLISIFVLPSTSYPTATIWTRINNSKRPLSNKHLQKSCRDVVYMYTDIMELNEAIKNDSSAAYDLFLAQEGNIDMDTVYLVVCIHIDIFMNIHMYIYKYIYMFMYLYMKIYANLYKYIYIGWSTYTARCL